MFFLISWLLWSDSRHFIEGGDIFFPIDQRLLLSKIAQAWWPDQLGNLLFNASGIPVRAFLAFLQLLGFTPVAIDRAFLAFFYGLSAAGMYLLASRFWAARGGAWVTAIWYPCGIYYCQAIPNENNVVSLAVVPLLAYLAVRAFESPAYILAFGFASLSLGFLAANPPTLLLSAVLIAALCLVALIGTDVPQHRFVITAFSLVAVSAALNLWWVELTKVAIASNAIVAPGATDWSWVLRRSTFFNIVTQTSFWGFGYGSDPWKSIGTWYLTSPFAQTALVLTPLAALGGILLSANYPDRKRAFALGWCCVAAIVLAKGTHEPAAWFNALLYRYVPLMFLFREPVKFLVVLATAFPLLAGLAYAVLAQKFASRPRLTLGIVFVTVAVVTGWPLLSGWAFSYATGQQSRVQIPPYWEDAARFINRDNVTHQRVLLLPQDGFYQAYYRWGLNGVDRIAESTVFAPVVRITADQNTYLQNQYAAAMIGMIDRAYRAQNGAWLATELQRASIGYVILRDDLVVDGRSMSVPESKYALLRAGAREIARFGALEIYRTPTMPALSAPAAVVHSCASPEGELEAAMRLPLSVVVVRSDMPECRANHSFLQAIPRRGEVVPAHALVLRQESPFAPAHALFKRHDVALPPAKIYDVTAQVVPPDGSAEQDLRSDFADNWRLLPGTGAVMRRCIRLGNPRYLVLVSEASARAYAARITFSADASCPKVPDQAPIALLQQGQRAITTLPVPVGSRTALVTVRPSSGSGRSDRPLPFAPAVTVQDIFASGALQPRAPVVYQAGLPLAPGMLLYGVSWPSVIVFRLPDGRELNAFIYRNGASSTELRVDNIFERIFQLRSGPAGKLRTSRVTVERIVPMATSRLADRLTIDTLRSDGGWSLERIAHTIHLRPRAHELLYSGTPLNNSAPRTGAIDLWWNSGRLVAKAGQWAVMRQSFNNQWTASGAATQGVADGYANAWRFPNAGVQTAYVRLNVVEVVLGIFAGLALLVTVVIIGAILYRARPESNVREFRTTELRRTRT